MTQLCVGLSGSNGQDLSLRGVVVNVDGGHLGVSEDTLANLNSVHIDKIVG